MNFSEIISRTVKFTTINNVRLQHYCLMVIYKSFHQVHEPLRAVRDTLGIVHEHKLHNVSTNEVFANVCEHFTKLRNLFCSLPYCGIHYINRT